MKVTKPIDFRANMKAYMDDAYRGDAVIIARPRNENVVIISENEYNDFLCTKRLRAYAEKLRGGTEPLSVDNI